MTKDTGKIPWLKLETRAAKITRKTAPPFEQFETLVLGMDQEIDSSPCWRGDLFNQGLKWYGEDRVMQLFGDRPSWKTWQNNGSVMGRIPPSRRRELPVTYSHHAEVAYLEPEDFKENEDIHFKDVAEIQDHYLQLTIDNLLTIRQLRAKIKFDQGEGEDPLGPEVTFRTGTIPTRIEKTRDRISRIIEDTPDEWDTERKHMEKAYSELQLALESAQNRTIGEPGIIDVSKDITEPIASIELASEIHLP